VYSKLVKMQLEMNKVKQNFIDAEGGGGDDEVEDPTKSEEDAPTMH
jgi:hypothetical protein